MPHFHAIRTRLLTAVQLAQHIDASKGHGHGSRFPDLEYRLHLLRPERPRHIDEPKGRCAVFGRFAHCERRSTHRLGDRDGAFPPELKIALQAPGSAAETLSGVRLSRTGKRPLVVRFERFGTQLADVYSRIPAPWP
jgi:hypothetical protein